MVIKLTQKYKYKTLIIMLNWLRGKFGKRNNTNTNLTITDDDLDEELTIANKVQEGISQDEDQSVLEFARQMGVDPEAFSREVAAEVFTEESQANLGELSSGLKVVGMEHARKAAKESATATIEEAKSNLLLEIDTLVLRLSEIEDQQIITTDELGIINTLAIEAKNLDDVKLVERRIKNVNIRIEALQLALEENTIRQAQSVYDKMLINGVEILEIGTDGLPSISKVRITDEVKALFPDGRIPNEAKVAQLILDNPKHFEVLQKIKNGFGDKGNVRGYKYNTKE
jgi:hypothetical protein